MKIGGGNSVYLKLRRIRGNLIEVKILKGANILCAAPNPGPEDTAGM